MPVISPSYTSSSNSLSGSYRSTLTSSSSLDKPYYRTSCGTYVSSTLRSSVGKTDVDGKPERTSLVGNSRNSRATSVADSDSLYLRCKPVRSESNKTCTLLKNMSMDLYNKYSPRNYVPLTQRIIQSNYGEIAKTESILNRYKLPSATEPARDAVHASNIRIRVIRTSDAGSSPTPTDRKMNSTTSGVKDTNGKEELTVEAMRKRFDSKLTITKRLAVIQKQMNADRRGPRNTSNKLTVVLGERCSSSTSSMRPQ